MLVDTNVLVAAAIADHPHHAPSLRLTSQRTQLTIAAHSVAEFFNTLTRPRYYGWSSERALLAIEGLRRIFAVETLSAEQSLAAITRLARTGGAGARVYDCLIGEVAIAHRLSTIVSLDTAHMTALFPQLRVVTPGELTEAP